MKRNQWAVVVGLMVIALGSLMTLACSTGGPHNDVDQAAIEANIRSQIATHYPGETFDIKIDVTEAGTVTLGGTVNDNDKRTRIGDIAKETPGVRRVVNNIEVKT